MTPEEKAKRYDEALRRARKLKEDPTSVFYEYSPSEGDTIVDYIFPELKEDDDEKIRKAIISGMTAIKEQGKEAFATIRINDCIAWLEKQGEQKPQGKTALEAINEEKVDNANKVEPKDYNSIDPHFGKPADKVEPKFKLGDWIIHRGTENVYQVIAVIDNYYHLKHDNNYTNQKCSDVDRCARLWDITKDAKDGDILANDHNILILKELVYDWSSDGTPNSVKGYCGIKPNSDFVICKDNWSFCGTFHIHPATKEQRDTLEKVMANAGYTFDFEKKELKKIKDETSIAVNNPDSYK